MWGKEQEDQLKAIMRSQELQRRATRMQVIKNHLELEKEKLTQEEKQLDKKIRGKYWRNLWKAILGKTTF
jgi:hypothetical protein